MADPVQQNQEAGTPDQPPVQPVVSPQPNSNVPSFSPDNSQTSPVQQQQDAEWNSFVDQHDSSNQQPDQSWDDFVKSQPEQGPSIASRVISGFKSAPGVADNIMQGIGAGINEAVPRAAKEFVNSFIIQPKDANDVQVSDDLAKFRNSSSYKEGAENFANMANDIIKPQADAFFKSAYYQQTKTVFDLINDAMFNFPVDANGKPVSMSPDEAIQKTMTILMQEPLTYTAISGVSAAGQEMAQPIAKRLFPNDLQAQQEYADGVGQGMVNLTMAAESGPPARPSIIARSESTGVFKGDDAYFNEPLIQEPVAKPIVQEANAEAPTSETSTAEEQPAAPKTINDIVRENNPVLFNQYDEISAKQERLRGWISDLSDKREASPEATETQGKIDIILGKVNGVEDRLTNKQAAALEDLRTKLDDMKSTDTPDMALVRDQLRKLDEQKRDMAEQVSSAYRDAHEQMPENEKPEVVEAGNGETQPINQPAEQQGQWTYSEGESQTTEVKPNTTEPTQVQNDAVSPPLDIAADIAKNLTAIGRPVEEAHAGGQIAARMYQYFSDMYGGAKGTAEDLYRAESPRIALKGEKGKVLAQNKLGQITLATKAARAVMRLSRTANASTFIHESAHHFLDMMERFSKEDGAPEQLKKDIETIRDWSGLPKNEAKTTGEKAAHTRAQEKFARGFERYLMEGVAPSKDLVAVFSKFKKWLTDIYETVQSIPNQKGGIDNNIRNFFDRVMTRNPDKTIIAPEHAESAEFATLHETDAEHTPPDKAEAVADNIYDERQKLGEKNGISTGQAAEGPTGPTEPATAGSEPELASGEEAPIGQPPEVDTSGDQAASEGPGLRSTTADESASGTEPGSEATGSSRSAAANATTDAEDAASADYADGERTNGTNPRPAGSEPYYLDKGGRFRLDKFNTSHDAMAMITEMAASNADIMDARYGTNAYKQARLIEANFKLIEQLAEEGSKLEKDFEKNPEEALKYVKISEQLRIAAIIRAELQSDWGHAGAALRRVSEITLENVEKVTGKTLYQLTEEARFMDQADTPEKKAQFANDMRSGKWRRFEDATLAYFRNAILSNPKTHAMYLAGNLFWAETKAIGTLGIAASIGAARDALGKDVADRVYFREIPRAVAAIHSGAMNAMILAPAIIKSGIPVMRGLGEGLSKDYVQSLPGKLGRVLTIPERSLAVIHTISYAMNFEMEIASRATRDGIKKGLDGDDLDLHISNYTQNPPPEIMQEAHEASLKAVFMNKPEYGSFQQKLGSLARNDVPGLRLITGIAMPFVQIGANIIDQGFLEHTPLGFVKQSIRDDISGKNGSVKKDMAISRMIVGSGMGIAAAGLATTGFMTGGGPTDYRKRAVLEATGWKPYSLKIGELYIPYKKWLGPMGPLMGACADLQETGHLLAEGDLSNATKAIAAGFGENVADETWMNGLSNLVQASQSSTKAWKFVENTAASFIPYSAGLNELNKQTNSTARLIRSDGPENLWGLLPTVQSRIPGLSYMLPAKVDVFGQPMPSSTGAGISFVTNDPLVQKLSDIGVGISQPSNTIRSIRLTNQQYNDYAITAGVLVKQNLQWVLNDKSFDDMSPSAKVKEIQDIVRQSRQAAQADIMFQNPEIIEKANAKKEQAEAE